MVYKIRKDNINFEDIGKCDTYGIDVFDDKGVLVKEIPDISFNENEMTKLVADCNEFEVDICHIDNIIEDFLG